MPKISVIIPTYNKSRFLIETVESVIDQTFSGYEVIVVDDGSTDDTRQVLKRYRPRVRYFYKNNGGDSVVSHFAAPNFCKPAACIGTEERLRS